MRHAKPCLDALIAALDGVDYEIIMVDNGSTDGTVALLRQYESTDVRLHCNDKNLGVAAARNVGLQKAAGKLLWLLDIDTVVNRDAWLGLSSFMDTHGDCGVCGCKLVSRSGEVQDSCRRLPSVRHKLLNVVVSLCGRSPVFKRLGNWAMRRNEKQYYHRQMLTSDPFEVEYVIGACQLLRSEAVRETGLLDERIFYGPEDADYCLRLSKKGWKIYYLPYCSFIHDYQRMTNKRLLTPMGWRHLKALVYFFVKHRRF